MRVLRKRSIIKASLKDMLKEIKDRESGRTGSDKVYESLKRIRSSREAKKLPSLIKRRDLREALEFIMGTPHIGRWDLHFEDNDNWFLDKDKLMYSIERISSHPNTLMKAARKINDPQRVELMYDLGVLSGQTAKDMIRKWRRERVSQIKIKREEYERKRREEEARRKKDEWKEEVAGTPLGMFFGSYKERDLKKAISSFLQDPSTDPALIDVLKRFLQWKFDSNKKWKMALNSPRAEKALIRELKRHMGVKVSEPPIRKADPVSLFKVLRFLRDTFIAALLRSTLKHF